MLTVEECKSYLADTSLTDARVEEIRNALYAASYDILDNLYSDFFVSQYETE